MPAKRSVFSIALGIAFLLQAVASLVGGMLFSLLIKKDDIAKTLLNLAESQTQAELSVFVEVITALGIIWLGALLFRLLHDSGQAGAIVAFAFYLLEACLLLVSRFYGHTLIMLSDAYSLVGDTSMETLGQVLLESKDYIGNVSLLFFGIGAMIFYYLLFKGRILPLWITLWGLIAVAPVFFVSVLAVLGFKIPFVLEASMVPYIPFEFFVGVYVLARGLSSRSEKTV